MTFQEGDAAAARPGLEESLAIFRELPDRMGVAMVLGMLGVAAAAEGDSAHARACFVEKRALWEQVGERSGIASALRDLGWLARREEVPAEARAHYLQALGLERDLGDAAGIAATVAGLGDLARDQGDYAQAAALYVEALTQLRGSEAQNECAACLEGLAAVAWAAGDAERATRLCGAAAVLRLPEITVTPAFMAGGAGLIAATRAVLGEEAFAAAWAAGQALALEDAVALALEKGEAPLPEQAIGPAPATRPAVTAAPEEAGSEGQGRCGYRSEPAVPTGVPTLSGTRPARADRQAWALERLRTAGPLSPRAYARAMAVSVDTALIDLRQLVAQGLVRAEGTTKDRRYLLRANKA
jgi:hypothetical protein